MVGFRNANPVGTDMFGAHGHFGVIDTVVTVVVEVGEMVVATVVRRTAFPSRCSLIVELECSMS